MPVEVSRDAATIMAPSWKARVELFIAGTSGGIRPEYTPQARTFAVLEIGCTRRLKSFPVTKE
jgi:hypothetical protein